MGVLKTILVAVTAIIATGYAIVEEFVPIGTPIREPTGAQKLETEKEIELSKKYQHYLRDIPHIERISYKLFISDKPLSEVKESYHTQLIGEGYKYEQDYSGEAVVNGYSITFVSYTKGLTAVVIFMSTGDIIGEDKEKTAILYTTGLISDYMLIKEWYEKERLRKIES